MSSGTITEQVREIMQDFASTTGLEPAAAHPRRYLWTDAFAVCNYLELFRQTGDMAYRDLALLLVDQVHHVLGRHREDDARSGWISGLDDREGELHPTIGGLRIGKPCNERGPDEPPDERREWDQDGQYYHYLTKWMHALVRVTRVTGDPVYTGWAAELAKTAHARFTYVPLSGGQKRMYWKMSIDLTRPLVPSMGLHDPLDGLVTYAELQMTVSGQPGQVPGPGLMAEISDMAELCRDRSFATDDPLGIGGLLADAYRIAQLMMGGGFKCHALLESVVSSALYGMESYIQNAPFRSPPGYRLAFRELGLSIGLHAIMYLSDEIERNPGLFEPESALSRKVSALQMYIPLADTIEQFWLDERNRKAGTWKEHYEINMVMLATSLAPEGFLKL
jgi:hypothetical protein